jgi:hypothetical protein
MEEDPPEHGPDKSRMEKLQQERCQYFTQLRKHKKSVAH